MGKWKLWFLLVVLLCSCQQNELKELEGHWHVTALFSDDYSDMIYHTIDIFNDTTCYYDNGYWGIDGFGGWIDLEEDKMYFGAECWNLSLQYFNRGDYLLLNEINVEDKDSRKFIAKKYDSTLCDKQLEFFNSAVYDIDLPISGLDELLISDVELSLLQIITFGQERNSPSGFFGMFLGNKKSGVEDIALWREKFFIKIPESWWDKVRVTIISSKDVPMDLIIPTLKWYKEMGEEKIYFALRNDDAETFKFLLKPALLDEINFSETKDLLFGEWIKSH